MGLPERPGPPGCFPLRFREETLLVWCAGREVSDSTFIIFNIPTQLLRCYCIRHSLLMVFTILMTRLRQAVKEEFAALADAQDGAALQADTKKQKLSSPQKFISCQLSAGTVVWKGQLYVRGICRYVYRNKSSRTRLAEARAAAFGEIVSLLALYANHFQETQARISANFLRSVQKRWTWEQLCRLACTKWLLF